MATIIKKSRGYSQSRQDQNKKRMNLQQFKTHALEQLRSVDRLILVSVIVLFSIGLLMIYSITGITNYNGIPGDPLFFVRQTLQNGLVGIVGMFIIWFLPNKAMKNVIGPLAVAGTLGILLLTLVIGVGTHLSPGVRRWIVLGPIRLQPAEFAKVGIILAVPWLTQRLVNEKKYYLKNWRLKTLKKMSGGYFLVLIYVLACAGLIAIQPDLGSAMVVGGMGVIMFLSSGIKAKQIGWFVLLGLALAAPVGFLLLQGYQMQRLEIWMDPFNHPRGLQNVMGFIAIALGGMFGMGLGNSIQKNGYVIEPHTDFIITVLAEELGAITVLVVIALFFLIAVRCFLTAFKGHDLFNSLACIGMGALFLIQPLINLGGASGLIPLSGVTLPLISFGGTSLMATLLMMGVYFNSYSEMLRQARKKEEIPVAEKIIPFKKKSA